MLQSAVVEQDKLYFANMRRVFQSLGGAGDGNLRGQLNRITVNAG